MKQDIEKIFDDINSFFIDIIKELKYYLIDNKSLVDYSYNQYYFNSITSKTPFNFIERKKPYSAKHFPKKHSKTIRIKMINFYKNKNK